MNLLLKKLDRGKVSSRLKITISPRILTIESNGKRRPKKIVVVLMRHDKRYECRPRQLVASPSVSTRDLASWPETGQESIEFLATLTKDPSTDQFAEKVFSFVFLRASCFFLELDFGGRGGFQEKAQAACCNIAQFICSAHFSRNNVQD